MLVIGTPVVRSGQVRMPLSVTVYVSFVTVQVQVQITLLLYETSNSLQLQDALHMEHNTELRFIQHSSTKQ